jgi:hypothetical protein
VPTDVIGDVELHPLEGGEVRTLQEWTNSFHLLLVAVDPFTFESAWILEQARKFLDHFAGADCRTAWLVTGSTGNARQFLGPLTDETLTFTDPDREVIAALDLEHLPAIVHLNVDHAVESVAEGWDPGRWQQVADQLASVMSWSTPNVGKYGGPAPYEGSPAKG